jgi:ArsR family transcriptional regulator
MPVTVQPPPVVIPYYRVEIRDLLKAFKALSDETRLRMLLLLLDRDVCICEMKEVLPLSASQLSRNLNMLLDAGFLRRWREGRCVVYTADRNSANPYCHILLDMLAESLGDSQTIVEDKKKLQQVLVQNLRQG